MRVIIGGAYNGKRKFVKEYLDKLNVKNRYVFEGEIPVSTFSQEDYVIIGNFEKIILQSIELDEEEHAAKIFDKLSILDKQTNVICICTDIGRGIVPLEKENRKLRDTCGRLYQKLFAESEQVIRIWYGLPEILKGGD